jgi:hypothetical protein
MFSQDIFVYIYSVFLPLVYLVELYYKNWKLLKITINVIDQSQANICIHIYDCIYM